MTHEDFVELVKKMREEQKRYFKLRDSAALTRSKIAEREVDQAIRVLQGLPL